MKSQIIAHLREHNGMTADQASSALDAVARAIARVADVEGSARVPGLGIFKMKDRASRSVRNPRTGDLIQTVAHRALTFKQGKS